MNGNLPVAVAVSSWELVLRRADALLTSLSDEQLAQHIAPNKNTVFYLLGHLTAVHDAMLPLLGLGERLHPELDEIFVKQPEGAVEAVPTAARLREYWKEVNSALSAAFASLPPEAWVQRHNSMTDEDYAKNPTRNRLAVLLSRTNHLSYHTGQIILIK